MRNAVWAELLLKLAMPPERASATAGDLAEGPAGTFRFWVSVLQTTAACCWTTITANRRRIGGLAGQVLLKCIGLQFRFTLLLFGTILVTAIVKNITGLTWVLWLPGVVEAGARGMVLPFLLGRWISQREPQNAMAAIVAFYGAMLLLSALSWAMGWSFVAPSGIRMEVWTMLLPIPGFAFTLVGAARERWNALQAG